MRADYTNAVKIEATGQDLMGNSVLRSGPSGATSRARAVAWVLSSHALMDSVSRTLPLRWVYPIIGAVVAGAGTALLYGFRAQPVLIGAVAVVACVIAGRLLGQRWDALRETATTDPLTSVS